MKKTLSLLMSLVMLLCLTTSASAAINTETQWPVLTDEDVAIDLAVCIRGSDGDVENMWLFKWLEEISGVTINVTGITQEAWETRKNLMMTSGDLADVYWGFNWSTTDLYNYGTEGDFLPLNDLLETYGKNIKVVDEYIGHDKMLGAATAPDGNIYGVPVMTEPASDMLNRTTYGWSINTDMLGAIGAEVPTTMEELYDVLTRLNDAGYNGTMSVEYDKEFRSLTLAPYQIITNGDVSDNIGLKQTEEGVWTPVFIPCEAEYKQWLTALNRFYAAGMLDTTFFTTDTTTRAAKNQENPAAVIQSDYSSSVGNLPEIWKQYKVFLLNESETLAPITYNTNHTAPGGFVVTSECERPDVAVALIDRLYDPATMLTTVWGPCMDNPDQYNDLARELKVAYKVNYNEDGTFSHVTHPELDVDSLGMTENEYMRTYSGPSQVYNNFYPISGLYARVLIYNAQPRQVGDASDSPTAYFRTQQQANIPLIAYQFPDVYLTLEDYERALELKGEIEDYVYSMEGRFISGELSIENEYDAFVEQLKKLNVEEYLGIYADAYALLG